MRTLLIHPAFWLLVFLPLGGALVLIVLGMRERAEVLRLADELAFGIEDLKRAWHSQPAPSTENVDALMAHAAWLRDQCDSDAFAIAAPEAEPGFRGPEELFFELADFTERMAAAAGGRGIELAERMRFGFRDIVRTGGLHLDKVPEDHRAQVMHSMHRQRQVLERLLEDLFEAQPTKLIAVRREPVIDLSESQWRRQPELFLFTTSSPIDVPEGIEALAFELVFEGHTRVLRDFLNSTALLELPVIVRRVHAEPGEAGQTSTPGRAPSAASRAPTPFELVANNPNPSRSAERDPTAVPIVATNASRFAVVVEVFFRAPLDTASGSDEGGAR